MIPDLLPPAESAPSSRGGCKLVALLLVFLVGGCLAAGLVATRYRYELESSLAVLDTRLTLVAEGDQIDAEGGAALLRERFRRFGLPARVSVLGDRILVDLTAEDRKRADPILRGGVEICLLAEASPKLSDDQRARELERIAAAQANKTWDLHEDDYATFPWHPAAYGAADGPLLLSTVGMIEADHFESFYLALDHSERPALGFTMTSEGARHLRSLSTANRGLRLAFVVDGRIRSAPVVRSALSRKGIVDGGDQGWTEDEAKTLVILLDSGSVDIRFRLLGQAEISPSKTD